MVSEKQFRERAKCELRQAGNQVLSLASDRDVYWKVEREIIQPNPHLHDAHHVFLDMLRGNYCEAMTTRALRLLDGETNGMSLPSLLAKIGEYPQLLLNKATEREFAEDRAALERAEAGLKCVVGPRIGHHERTLSALAATHRELDTAIDVMISTVKTYYWIVSDSYLDLNIKYAEDPLAIFGAAWATMTAVQR